MIQNKFPEFEEKRGLSKNEGQEKAFIAWVVWIHLCILKKHITQQSTDWIHKKKKKTTTNKHRHKTVIYFYQSSRTWTRVLHNFLVKIRDYSKFQKQSRENTLLGNNEKMRKRGSERRWRLKGNERKKKQGNKGKGN